MAASVDLSTRFALDVQAVNGLRAESKKTGEAGLEAAARQFEALFLNMLLKSMRDATPKDDLMESEQSRLYLSMLDQQFSQTMAARGIGLAEIMVRQLRQAAPPDTAQKAQAPQNAGGHSLDQSAPRSPAEAGKHPGLRGYAPTAEMQERLHQPGWSGAGQSDPSGLEQEDSQASEVPAHVSEFKARVGAYAQEVSQATGIPVRFMLGQAALESGWGKRELRATDGTPSHNLFGIKAGVGWKGPVVEAVTTEYINGIAHKRVEKFRAYPSYAEAFRDYANLLSSNPRYTEVLRQAVQRLDAEGFAHALQRAGYATDPAYGDKLGRIIKTTFGPEP
ncbi:MAG: flagellar assembly peptidoglycan hydrolase FlgJ [Nitrosospira multiformis]|nr:flagellar assembly peptidoglycan hydrolase FlgJ [Nitrosospira multiformis]